MSSNAFTLVSDCSLGNSILRVRRKAFEGLRPISANCSGCFSSKPPQNRHAERSASQIYPVAQRLVARSRRTPTGFILPMLFGAFRPPKPGKRLLLRYHLMVMGTFSCTNPLLSPGLRGLVLGLRERQWRVPGAGFGGAKAPNSMGKISTVGVLRPPRAQAHCHGINL
jgi:hypothetical protein